MGVDVHCLIPVGTDPEDIFKALGIVCGAEVEMHKDMSWCNLKKRDAVKLMNREGCLHGSIKVDTRMASAMEFGPFMRYPDYRVDGYYWLLSARASAYKIAVFIKLAKFFGGIVQSNDFGDGVLKYKGTITRKRTGETADDGEPYKRYQKAFMKLRGPSWQEIADAEEIATYKQFGGR